MKSEEKKISYLIFIPLIAYSEPPHLTYMHTYAHTHTRMASTRASHLPPGDGPPSPGVSTQGGCSGLGSQHHGGTMNWMASHCRNLLSHSLEPGGLKPRCWQSWLLLEQRTCPGGSPGCRWPPRPWPSVPGPCVSPVSTPSSMASSGSLRPSVPLLSLL